MAPIAGIQGFGNTLGMASNDGGSGTVGDIICFGAGGNNRPSITTDSSGNFYIVVTADQGYFGGEGAGQFVTPDDIMVIKFNSAFEVQWKKLIGTPPNNNTTSGQDFVGNNAAGKFGIATDDTHLWITFQERLQAYRYRIQVIKYNVSDGSVAWKRMIETADEDMLSGGLGIDSSGNAYVGYHGEGPGGDNFIMKLNSSGTKQWERQFGGTQQDEIYHMVVDSSGNVYTCGLHNRFPASGDLSTQPYYDWSWGIAKYNSSGTIQWYRAFGDSNYSGSGSSNPADRAYAMCLDSSGNIYVTGNLDGATGVVKYNSSGTMQWYRNYINELYPSTGGTGRAVCVDADDNVYVVSVTNRFFLNILQEIGTIFKWNSSGTLQYQQHLDFGFGSSGAGTAWDAIIQDNQIYVVGDNIGVLTISRLPTNDSQMPGFQESPGIDLCYFSVDYFGPHRPITSGSWNGYYISNRGYNQGVYDVSTQTVNSDASNWMMFKPFIADSTTLTDTAALYTGITTDRGIVGVSTAIENEVVMQSRQNDILFELDARNSSSWPGSGSTWSDLTGNNRNFTLSGATNGSDAVSFDGSDDYGEIAHAAWMPHSTEPLYIDAYITNLVLPGPGQFNAVLSKSNSSGTIQWGVGFYTTPGSSNNEYRMVFVATGTNNSLGAASATPIYYTMPDPSAMQTGYHHFGWAYEGNSFRSGDMSLYIDGVRVGFWQGNLNNSGTNYRLGDEDTSADLRIADSEAGAFIDNHLDGDIRVLRCYTEPINSRFNLQNWMNCIEEPKVFKYQIPN